MLGKAENDAVRKMMTAGGRLMYRKLRDMPYAKPLPAQGTVGRYPVAEDHLADLIWLGRWCITRTMDVEW